MSSGSQRLYDTNAQAYYYIASNGARIYVDGRTGDRFRIERDGRTRTYTDSKTGEYYTYVNNTRVKVPGQAQAPRPRPVVPAAPVVPAQSPSAYAYDVSSGSVALRHSTPAGVQKSRYTVQNPSSSSYGAASSASSSRPRPVDATGLDDSFKTRPIAAECDRRTLPNNVVANRDPRTGVETYTTTGDGNVRSTWQKGPSRIITDPAAREQGLNASKFFRGSGSEATEQFDGRYKVRKSKDNFFRLGRVFMYLYAEPLGQFAGAGTDVTAAATDVTYDRRFGQPFHIKPRRFVVITEGRTFCTAIAVWTYQGQGVAKRGVVKADHAVIYSGASPPDPNLIPTADERPARGEYGMQPHQLRVDINDPTDALSPMSRINFAKVYTIEHNVAVRDIGLIHPRSMPPLFGMLWLVQQLNTERTNPFYQQLQQNAADPMAALQAMAASRTRSDSAIQPPGASGSRGQVDVEDHEDEYDR